MLKLLLQLLLYNTHQDFHRSLDSPTLKKVSFQPPVQKWEAWLNGAMKFCIQSNTFSDSQSIFCGASICVIHLWAFTDSSCFLLLLLFWLPTQTQVLHVLFPTCHQLVTAEQKDCSCIFKQLPSSCTPHPGSLSCKANSKVTPCTEAVTEEVQIPWPFVWLQHQSLVDFTRHYIYLHPLLVFVPQPWYPLVIWDDGRRKLSHI